MEITSGKKINIFLVWATFVSTIILFGCSNLRFELFGAGVDLGFFDQLLYLQSQGLPPISTILQGVHLIGDHVAVILYPLSLLYKIYPSVYWLFWVQAIAFSLGILPLYYLSKQQGITKKYAQAIGLAYLLYPAIFNINFYTEFRPEVISVPLLIWAMYELEKQHYFYVAIALVVTIFCKETMAFSVFGVGVFIFFTRKQKIFAGIICLFSISWLLFSIYYIVPNFRGGASTAGIWYYASLGGSFSELVIYTLTHPWIIIQRGVLPDRLFYYLLLVAPIAWGLSWKKIYYCLPAIPTLLLNILSDDARVRDLIHHYSLPIIPFLFIWLVHSVTDWNHRQARLWLSPKKIIIWAIVAFLALAKYSYFYDRYLPLIPYNSSVEEALVMIDHQSSVVTSSYIANHLTHRPNIYLFPSQNTLETIDRLQAEYVLTSVHHLDRPWTKDGINNLTSELKQASNYDLLYGNEKNKIFLWQKAVAE